MVKVANVRSCFTALAVLLAAGRADAAGKLLGRSAQSLRVSEARVALAQGPSRATAWHQLRFDGASDEWLWLLPVPAGASVDIGTTSFFDALEESTAPHVLPPSGQTPTNRVCTKPKPEVVGAGDAESTTALLGQEVFSEASAIETKLTELGYAVDATDLDDLKKVVTGGSRLLALRLGASSEAVATPTVRINGVGVGLAALPLLRAPSEPINLSLWSLGDGRSRMQGASEVEMEPSALYWLSTTKSNYTSLRAKLLQKNDGANLLLEVTGAGPLRDLVALPGGSTIPPVLDTYLTRAFLRGEAAGDLGSFSSQARAALGAIFQEPCPRGDLLPATGEACVAGDGDPVAPLVPTPAADDLAFVFAGDSSQRWISRLAGQIPATRAGRSLTATFASGESVSLLYTPANLWDNLCSAVVTGGKGGSSGKGGTGGSSLGGGPLPGSTGGANGQGGSDDGEEPVEDSSSSSSCNAIFIGDGCNGDSSGSDSSEGCNCNDTSSESDTGSSEGCGCGESSGDGGQSCDSGDSGGNSCSGSDVDGGGDSCGSGSSGGSSCGKDCSVGRGGRRSPRLSKWLLLITALALPLRRLTRPRGAKRSNARDGN